MNIKNLDIKKMGDHFKKARTIYNQHGNQSPYDVQENTKLSNSTIYELEAGKKKSGPSAEVIQKLAQYYGVSAHYLLGLTDDPRIVPSVVDELGLSPEAIENIKTFAIMAEQEEDQNGPHHQMLGALDYFLRADSIHGFIALFTKSFEAALTTKLAYRQMMENIGQTEMSYELFSAMQGRDKYPFVRYSAVQDFERMLDSFCNIDLMKLELLYKAYTEGYQNGEHPQD